MPKLRCPRCHNEVLAEFQVHACIWCVFDDVAGDKLRPSDGEDAIDYDDDSSVECTALVDDAGDADPAGEETCDYRAPLSDFVRAGAGESVPIKDYTDEHGGYFKP